jgi:hypothetical protein
MPKIQYESKRFRAATLEVIDVANDILEQYAADGYDLTLRQLYYQFVSRDLIPNTQREYNRLGSIVNDARLAGLIDWNHIVDRTRNLRELASWKSPRDIVKSCAYQYRIDMWMNQPCRVEVWIEKDALVGVISRQCQDYGVPYFSCRGYTSQSEMWNAGMRLGRYADQQQDVIVLHFGDHDPSGIDMTRDIQDRLDLFTDQPFGGRRVEVRRMALNRDQVDMYNPPPNPAKLTDSRAVDYIERHGSSSWELDALEPKTINQLIEDTVLELRDDEVWEEDEAQVERERATLTAIAGRWDEVADFLND